MTAVLAARSCVVIIDVHHQAVHHPDLARSLHEPIFLIGQAQDQVWFFIWRVRKVDRVNRGYNYNGGFLAGAILRRTDAFSLESRNPT